MLSCANVLWRIQPRDADAAVTVLRVGRVLSACNATPADCTDASEAEAEQRERARLGH